MTTPPHAAASSPHPTTAHLRWLLRLHRPALAIWLALVLLLAALQLAGWVPFVDEGLRSVRYGEGAILRHDDLFGYATTALMALPLVVGAWSGAALFGRDLESGTARLTWSQGVTPARWLGGGLLAPAVLLTVGAGLLVVLHRLTWQAGDSESVHVGQWYEDDTLFTNGPAVVALVLAGLAGGALAALLCRRTLPALAVGAGIALAVREATVRVTPYLWPTVTDTTGLHAGYRSSGLEVAAGVVTSSGAHIADPGCGPVLPEDGGDSCQAVYDKVDGAGFYVTYHPESHFWPLQFAATGFALAVAGLLAWAAFLVLRRTYGPAGSGAPENTGADSVRSGALKEVTV
ncbi:ABC transporter permease [Streptomyces sp. V2]|uniref:ABC transporter permease n=1 Tax=Streptomyces TaxID=1883 RepID=UPI000D66D632|nr:ABC transporter permease [Streptomyces sp. V2]PWG09421.1 ABC transporter permease [Streptomyces sp. V2]